MTSITAILCFRKHIKQSWWSTGRLTWTRLRPAPNLGSNSFTLRLIFHGAVIVGQRTVVIWRIALLANPYLVGLTHCYVEESIAHNMAHLGNYITGMVNIYRILTPNKKQCHKQIEVSETGRSLHWNVSDEARGAASVHRFVACVPDLIEIGTGFLHGSH